MSAFTACTENCRCTIHEHPCAGALVKVPRGFPLCHLRAHVQPDLVAVTLASCSCHTSVVSLTCTCAAGSCSCHTCSPIASALSPPCLQTCSVRAQSCIAACYIFIGLARTIYVQCIYGVFLAAKSPNIRSYTVYINGSGQPYTFRRAQICVSTN